MKQSSVAEKLIWSIHRVEELLSEMRKLKRCIQELTDEYVKIINDEENTLGVKSYE